MISPYLVENKHVAVKRARHGVFLYNRNDTFVGRSLDLYGEWCEPELILLRHVVRPGDVVVDVGANIGTHTVPFASWVGSRGRVYAFEPQRLQFQLLCGNVALNGLDNVWAYAKAVGSAAGEMQLPEVPSLETPFNFAAVSMRKTPSRERVGVISVDALSLKACRLIKIDVEGMEADVLRGARKTIAAFKPCLFVENNAEKPSDTLPILLELGYKIYWHLSPYFHEANFYGNTHDVFGGLQPEANMLCVPADWPAKITLTECTGPDDTWRQARARGQKS